MWWAWALSRVERTQSARQRMAVFPVGQNSGNGRSAASALAVWRPGMRGQWKPCTYSRQPMIWRIKPSTRVERGAALAVGLLGAATQRQGVEQSEVDGEVVGRGFAFSKFHSPPTGFPPLIDRPVWRACPGRRTPSSGDRAPGPAARNSAIEQMKRSSDDFDRAAKRPGHSSMACCTRHSPASATRTQPGSWRSIARANSPVKLRCSARRRAARSRLPLHPPPARPRSVAWPRRSAQSSACRG